MDHSNPTVIRSNLLKKEICSNRLRRARSHHYPSRWPGPVSAKDACPTRLPGKHHSSPNERRKRVPSTVSLHFLPVTRFEITRRNWLAIDRSLIIAAASFSTIFRVTQSSRPTATDQTIFNGNRLTPGPPRYRASSLSHTNFPNVTMPPLMELWSIIYLGGEAPSLKIVWSTEESELYIESQDRQNWSHFWRRNIFCNINNNFMNYLFFFSFVDVEKLIFLVDISSPWKFHNIFRIRNGN